MTPQCGLQLRLARAVWRRVWLVVFVSVGWLAGPVAASAASNDQSVVRATLGNGLEVVIVHNALAPVVSTVLNYKVGGNETPPEFPGSAHAVEHMMFRGSPGLSANQLAQITAGVGGMFDAATQQTVTQYFATVQAEDLGVVLHLEALRMRAILADEEAWAQERKAIEQEVAQDFSNPEYVSYTRLLAVMFAGTAYARDALGTRPSFDKTTAAMLKDFHATWYAPNNAILVIVGDVEPQAVLAEVTKLFGDIPANKLPPRPEIRPRPLTAQTLQFKTDQPYGQILVAFRMPGFDSADNAATQVLADVLDSQRGELYELAAEGKALQAGFELDTLPRAGLGFAIAQFAPGADVTALERELRDTLTTMIKKGFAADMVEAAKRREVAQAEFQRNSVSGLAMTWSQALAVEGRRSPQDDVNAITRVSVADVDRVARSHLDLEHAVVVIMTPEPSAKPVTTGRFGGKESFAPTKAAAVKLPRWARQALKRLAVPASTVHPTVSTLANGLTLIVQPESVSNTVSVYGHIKNRPELEAPKGQEGVDELLDQLFSYGTASLDRLAFQKALDEIGASESAGSDFELHVLTDRFERGLALLADNELHPALPEAAFRIVRQQVADSVAGEHQSPDYLWQRALRVALFPQNDPALREPTPATVSSLSLADVTAYYRRTYRPDLATIVVIGNVTPDSVHAMIEKYFGAWSAIGPKPPTRLPPVPSNKASTTAVPDTSRVQDRVVLAQTLMMNRFDPDYYPLELGNHVLGGGFYATRLYRDLRERSGLVYYVSSWFDVGDTRGVYGVSFACDPPNVSKAYAIVKQELEHMQSERVSVRELRQAKALLLREIPLAESSIGSIARGLIERSDIGLPLDEPTRAAHRYLKLSAEQVRAAYAKWVRPADLVQVSVGPALP